MKTQIFQICYNDELLSKIPEGFLALNNVANLRPDWREYWPIRNYLKNNYLSDDVLYGFLSPNFYNKTLLQNRNVQSFLSDSSKNQDVVSFSPFWDLASIFKNVFEQGDFFHPGLANVCQSFCDIFMAGLDTDKIINHSKNVIFCNYFLAKKKFWLEWLDLGEKLFNCAEHEETPLAFALNRLTNYGDEQLPMKVFVQERLANLVLAANSNITLLAYSPFNSLPSTTPFAAFFNEAVISDSLKICHSMGGHAVYLNEFALIRDKIVSKLGGITNVELHPNLIQDVDADRKLPIY